MDEVYIIYSEFQSVARQEPVIKQLLPIPSLADMVEDTPADVSGEFLPEHICEPSSDVLLGEMLPKNVFIQIYDALLQTSTSEHTARMRAMENATKHVKTWWQNFRPSLIRLVRPRLQANSWISSVVRKRSRDKTIYLTVTEQLYLGEKNG